MGFRAGIVGLPNVGKSTIFNALTSAGASASNFPFCTISPNVGVVPVHDERLKEIDHWVHAEKVVSTMMEFVDVAGLVKGASKGEGLGNQFLGKILELDALIHVVRCFEDPNIVHVDGSIDPLRDIGTVETELILKDLDAVEKFKLRTEKQARSGDNKEAKKQLEAIKILEEQLNVGKSCRILENIDELVQTVPELRLLTSKKVLYVVNISSDSIGKENSSVQKIKELASNEKSEVVELSGEIEAEIAELPENERAEYLKSMGIEVSGQDRLVQSGYNLLGLISFFTAGPKEVRAWTIHKGWTAKQAAGVIHSDFERGFIRAEVISFEDFTKYGGEAKAKEKGKLRVEGKEYIVYDADILHFRFSV